MNMALKLTLTGCYSRVDIGGHVCTYLEQMNKLRKSLKYDKSYEKGTKNHMMCMCV